MITSSTNSAVRGFWFRTLVLAIFCFTYDGSHASNKRNFVLMCSLCIETKAERYYYYYYNKSYSLISTIVY